LKHTICRKVRNFKKQNTISLSHPHTTVENAYGLYKLEQSILNLKCKNRPRASAAPCAARDILKCTDLKEGLTYLIKILLIFNFITICKADAIGASITTVCFTANGIIFIYLMMVKIFVSSYNPQITKARVNILNLHKSKITLNSGLSMRVGISEAIRMLFFSSFKLLFIKPSPFSKAAKTRKAGGYKIFKVLYLNLPFKTMPVFVFLKKKTAKILSELELLLRQTPRWGYNSNIINLKPLKAHSQKDAAGERICNLNSNTLSSSSKAGGAPEDNKFNQWLAGLIDGDGCFQLSKKGYASLEIVAHIRDKNCLYQIKQKFGGAVKLRTNLNHLRFRMHHKKGMLDIINAVNGEIRNPIRLLQLSKICDNYKIPVIQPAPLKYENAWLSGFFDSDGSIYLNLKSYQMLITASQKNKYLLDFLCELYGGSVYIEKTSFKWIVFKKSEISKLLEYFKLNPCRSAKLNRINAITKYMDLRDLKAHLANESTILGKAWKKFLLRWDKWEKI